MTAEDEEFVEIEVPYSLIARADQVAARYRDALGLDHFGPEELLDAALEVALDDPEFIAQIAARLARPDT